MLFSVRLVSDANGVSLHREEPDIRMKGECRGHARNCRTAQGSARGYGNPRAEGDDEQMKGTQGK